MVSCCWTFVTPRFVWGSGCRFQSFGIVDAIKLGVIITGVTITECFQRI